MNTTQLSSLTSTQRKQARSKNQPVGQWIRTDKRLAIYLRDRFSCSYCGTNLQSHYKTDGLHLDHLISKEEGGGNGENNLTTGCQSCNCSRQAKSLTEFTTPQRILAIQVRCSTPLAPYRTVARDIIAGNISITEGLDICSNF